MKDYNNLTNRLCDWDECKELATKQFDTHPNGLERVVCPKHETLLPENCHSTQLEND